MKMFLICLGFLGSIQMEIVNYLSEALLAVLVSPDDTDNAWCWPSCWSLPLLAVTV